MFNVAVVGTGRIYRLAHGPAWRAIPLARVVAVCDRLADRAEAVAREWPGAAAFTQLEDLLETVQVDVVDVCTPTYTHAGLAIRALQAGAHVICEKPMALTPEEGTRMIAAAGEAKRHLYIGHTRRFDARWVQLKEQIAAGQVGELSAITRTERCWGTFEPGDWHWDLRRSGGVLLDVGVHVVDLFAWFFEAEPSEVSARAEMVREEAQAHGCFDVALIEVGFPGGRRGLMEVSWAHPRAAAPFYSTTVMIGTRGRLTVSDEEMPPLTLDEDDGLLHFPLRSTAPETFVDELSHFLDCIEGRAVPRSTPRHALTAVRAMAAAFESIASGRRIPLGE